MTELMRRRRAMMTQKAGGPWWTSGELDYAQSSYMTIQHNLNTEDVGLWVYPKDNLEFSAKDLFWQINLIDWPSIIPENITLDFTNYNNSNFPDPIQVSTANENWRVCEMNVSPYATASFWTNFNQTAGADYKQKRKYWTKDKNSIGLSSGERLVKGKFTWIAIDLNKAYQICKSASGFITQTSANRLNIPHNLNATQILLLVFPTGDTNVVPATGYQPYYFGRLNFDALKPPLIEMDFTPYSTGITTVQSLEPSTNISEIQAMCSPWTSTNTWYKFSWDGTKDKITYNNNAAETTFNVAKTKYRWIAIDLSDITL